MHINDLKKMGTIINLNNEPYSVIFSQHSKTARGQAFIRTKLKNLITGQVLEKTFNASDKIIEADIEKSKANYLYKESDKLFFMDADTYEQFFLSHTFLIDKEKFLKQGEEVRVLIFNKNPVNIELPKKVNLIVIEAPPSIKGDSATAPTKTIILETGTKINAPIFIKKGDTVIVNTDTGEYVSRL